MALNHSNTEMEQVQSFYVGNTKETQFVLEIGNDCHCEMAMRASSHESMEPDVILKVDLVAM